MSDLDLAVIGNCSFGALIDRRGRVCWCPLPHFDGDPVFCSLHSNQSEPEAGFSDVVLERFERSEQRYLENTAICVTELYDEAGAVVEITDFAPRFRQFGRNFRPTMLVRRVRALRGTPRVRLRVRPLFEYGARSPEWTRGSNHIRYVGPHLTLRLTTDAPVSHITGEVPFLLDEPITMVLGPDESLTRSATAVGAEFFAETEAYWREFSRHLAIPFEWQEAVIRAAITLKLCHFEETGAVVAAMTTSIPEFPNSGRNWDYRYCWLRDAYFVVHALNRLGATRTMEGYLRYITNVAAGARDGVLGPVYGIKFEENLAEREIDSLPGYLGMGPVRVGNQAWEQVQNDSYGSVILAVTQAFFDRRLTQPGSHQVFEVLEKLGEQAAARFDQPDAGLWEFRAQRSVHTFSSVMCWVACDRLARIARRLSLVHRHRHWRSLADRIHGVILEQAWNDELGCFGARFGGDGVDASLLLLAELGFVDAGDPRFEATVQSLEKHLSDGPYFFRYLEDEMGRPKTAFVVCSFWYIDALIALGRRDQARELFQEMLGKRNSVGLLSEDVDPETGKLWGNFPQTYSAVGLINSALRTSRSWEGAF